MTHPEKGETVDEARARFALWGAKVWMDLVALKAKEKVAKLEQQFQLRHRVCKLRGCNARFLANKRQEYCRPEHGQQARDQRKAERKAK